MYLHFPGIDVFAFSQPTAIACTGSLVKNMADRFPALRYVPRRPTASR